MGGGGWRRRRKLPPFRNTAEFIYACHAILLAFRYPPSITALMPAAHLEAFSLPLNPRRTCGSVIRARGVASATPRVQTYTENSCAPSIVSDPRFSRRKKDGELTENSGSPTSPFTALHRGVLQACRSRPNGKYGMSYTRRAAFIGTYLEESADSPPCAGISTLRCRLRIP